MIQHNLSQSSFVSQRCTLSSSSIANQRLSNRHRRRRKLTTRSKHLSLVDIISSRRTLMVLLMALMTCTDRKNGSTFLTEAKSAKANQDRSYNNGGRKPLSVVQHHDHWNSLRCGAITRNKTVSSVTTRPPQNPPPPPPPPDAKEETNSESSKQVEDNEKKDDPRILMLIRLLFITYYGSLGSLLPYLPVYYHSLGHGGQIIGMLGAIKPFTTFLVAPFWGIVSDQTGSPFTVLYFTFLLSLVGQLMVAWKHDPTYIMTMVFITAFFNAPVKSLIDSMVMDHLLDRSRYGRLRLWGQLGFGVGSSSVGVLLSKSKHRAYHPTPGLTIIQKLDNFWQSLTGYKLLFLSHAILSVPTWWCIRAFHKLHNEKEKEKQQKEISTKSSSSKNDPSSTKKSVGIWHGINVLFHNSDAVLFFFLVLVVGISSGVIENFAYVRIREVGGTGKDMGLSRLVSSMAGAPMFWFSGPLTEMFGADRVIVFSLLSYVARFCIYALMRTPYQGLPAEAMRGVTFAAFWSTCTIYASKIAPEGLRATMLMFLNAMYGGLGQSLGAIIGGKLQHKFGTVRTFLYAAFCDLCFVCIVSIYLAVRKDSNFKNPTPIVTKDKTIAAAAVVAKEATVIEDVKHHNEVSTTKEKVA